MADLRKDKSAPASLKVKYKSATVEQFVAQFGADISPTGIFVKTKKPVETGALLKFNFLLADKSSVLSGVGKVVWRREPGAEYPAGMGIRFIKLAGESQAVVNRIVQERGRPESRFDQHQGAELAAASLAPGRTAGTPAAPAPPAAPAAAARVPAAPAVVAPPPPPATAAPAPAPPASAAAIASATAPVGLFANTAISKSDPPPLPATPARTSFFPPVPGGASDDGGLALAGAVAAAPAPAAAAAAAPAAAPAGDVVDQLFATVASEDDAAAGGGDFANAATVAAVPAPMPAAATPASDAEAQSVDALFDDLAQAEVSAPAASPPAATPGSAETSFAGLAESEAPPPLAPAADAAPEDDLFAAVDDEEVDPFADVDQVDALDDDPGGWVDDDDDGDVDILEMEEFGEADIFGSTSAPPPPEGVGSVAPQLALADEVPVAPAKKRSPVLWIVLLAAGGGAAFFVLQQPGGLGALLGGSQAAAPTATPLEPAPAGQPAENARGAAAEAAGADVAQEGAAGQGTGEEMVIGAEEVAEGDRADEQAPAAGDAPGAQGGGEAAAVAAAANLPPVRVEITSVPRGSEVLLDGKPVGTTPTRLELAVGKEVAVTVRTKGYAALTKKVRPAAPPDPVRFKLDPLPYELVVKTTPRGAEVSVGEVSEVSPAPLKLGHLLGSVHVGVAKEGYRRMTRPVRLEEFSERDGVMRAVVEVRLSPLPGVVKPTKKKKRYY